MSKIRESKFFFSFLFFLSIFIFSSYLMVYGFSNEINEIIIDTPIENADQDDFNVLDFWNNEIIRVNNTPLNLEFGKNHTIDYTNPSTNKDYEFTAQEVVFDSPNWVHELPSKITIYGYLLYPEKVKYSDSGNPGALVMHGLNGDAEQGFSMAYTYLEEGFVVLCHSFPGHGKSGGASPSPSNVYFEGTFNESSHFYLSICSAVQGLRVLENLTLVDKSEIMVAGGSFGALNTMWLSGICGERIAGAVPMGAIGNFKIGLEDPTKLLFWILDKRPEEIPDKFWENQNKRIDPMYYMKSEKLPPILFQLSTNDEFFHYHQLNGTYNAVKNEDQAFIQVYPNGHHAISGYQDTTKFFMDYIIDNGSAPPQIEIKSQKKTYGIFGDTLKIKVETESSEDIKSVQVCYHYNDIIGACWETFELSETDDDEWEGILSPGIITSNVDYYIIVNLKGDEDVWFCSKIFTPGLLIGNFTVIFYILIISFIAIPTILLVRSRFKQIRQYDQEIQAKARKNLIIELIVIGIIEALFYISFILPWVVLESGGVTWTHIYFFNNVYTWKEYFGFFSTYMTAAFIMGWIIYSQLSIKKPLLSGIIKILYPIFGFIVFGWYLNRLASPETSTSAQIFGAGHPGIGMILMLFCSIATIIVGIWKRKNKSKYGIREEI